MTDFLKKIHAAKREVVMNPLRKQSIRANVEAFMEAHPVGSTSVVRRWFQVRVFQVAVAVVIVMVVLSGGTTYVAAQALPGDILYPVKLNVNETVKGSFKFSDESKTEWEIERAALRLEEADSLAVQNRFTEKRRAAVEAAFTRQAERVQKRVEKVADSGNAEAAEELHDRYEAVLSGHRQVFGALQRRNEHDDTALKPLQTIVDAALTRVSEKPDANDNGQADGNESEKVKSHAEVKIDRAGKVISETKRDDKEKSSASERLEAAEKLLNQAREQYKSGSYNESGRKAREAFRSAREAEVVRRAEQRLNFKIDVRLGGEVKGAEQNNTSNKGLLDLR